MEREKEERERGGVALTWRESCDRRKGVKRQHGHHMRGRARKREREKGYFVSLIFSLHLGGPTTEAAVGRNGGVNCMRAVTHISQQLGLRRNDAATKGSSKKHCELLNTGSLRGRRS